MMLGVGDEGTKVRQAETSAGIQQYGGGVEKWKRAGEDQI
jgi:hypothetical protein